MHLNEETIPIMEKSIEEKIAWVRKDHFVYYPRAMKILDELRWILEQVYYNNDEDFPSKQAGLTIIGDPGTGKTTLFHQFMRILSCKHDPPNDGYPVKYCIMKDSVTGLKGLYSSILSAYDYQYSFELENMTTTQLEGGLIHILKKSGTKLLFIDEFQHTRGQNLRSILNQLKRTMSISQVSLVLVGTPEMLEILHLDPQLADQCPIKDFSVLGYWHFDEGFRKFLATYEGFLPFPEPSNLSSMDLASEIFEKVKIENGREEETNLRRVVIFLKKISVVALKRGHDKIEEEDIREIP